jgi:hypothetical protein
MQQYNQDLKMDKKKNKELTAKRSLTDKEQQKIARLKERCVGKTQPLVRIIKKDDEETVEVAFDKTLSHAEAEDLFNAGIMHATGTSNISAGNLMIGILEKTINSREPNTVDRANYMNTRFQALQAFAPQDEYEGQLVSQLLILHEHAMDWLGRAIRTERVDFANVYLNGASKLLTRHHETLDTLLKYRRRGEQRVHVEHVHIHGGAQAIVGSTVTTGAGMNPKFMKGPHAKV